MLLNEKQLRLLKVIDSGNTTGDQIADAMGSSMQMIRYYLDTMAEDEYLKAAKVYDSKIQDFQIVRAYLTEKGKAALEESLSPKPKVTIADQTASQTANHSPFSDIQQINSAFETFHQILGTLPNDRREVATVYLDDLQNEINIVYRRKPHRIKAYFLAFVGTALPIVKETRDATLFIQHARFLSDQLNVPVKLPRLA
jgi:DeoR family transcriptional regulator, catabolite repression regulator